MPRYRKRPIVIEAVRYSGPGDRPDDPVHVNVTELQEFGAQVEPDPSWNDDHAIQIWNEPEGCWVRCPVGHWVIEGVAGEYYPCDPDVFDATYESA